MRKPQAGFTLIEIAIVLVIIGLLLGGVLKGQELITSARVRNLISQQDGIKAAYFGFLDRFRALPGDYTAAVTNIPNVGTAAGCGGIAPQAAGNGNGNGRIESGAGAGNENILAWDHLSHAGFINGTYICAGTESNTTTPSNPYASRLQLIFDNVYGIASGGVARHNLKTGANVPVEIIVEVDRKIDDGLPYTGSFQFSAYTGGAAAAPTENGANTCTSGNTTAATWNAINGQTNCGGASLF
jgi:prepilin-type N-terminal cleavage/methylation domain-containing protein